MKHKTTLIIVIILIAVLVTGGIFLLLKGKQPTKEQVSTSAAPKATVKIACVGDSITYGYKLQNREETAYPAQLAARLGSGYKVANYGVVGRTVALSGDFPYALEDAYEQSKAFAPDIVLLMLGTNDTKKVNWNKQQFENDYAFIVEGYRGLPNAPKVYLLTPPPLYVQKSGDNVPNQAVLEKEIVPFIRTFAQEEKLPLIDVYAAFEGKAQWFSDGCHPNEAGAKELATLIYRVITRQ